MSPLVAATTLFSFSRQNTEIRVTESRKVTHTMKIQSKQTLSQGKCCPPNNKRIQTHTIRTWNIVAPIHFPIHGTHEIKHTQHKNETPNRLKKKKTLLYGCFNWNAEIRIVYSMKWCKLIRFNLIIYDDIVLSVESLTTSRFFHDFFIYNNSILILRMQFLSSRKKKSFYSRWY